MQPKRPPANRYGHHASQEIEGLLGYVDEPEIVHRDSLIPS
ncbi:hypothetical protein [Propionivibrio sp.]|nr:hypothetical protein [Propionivibrio sp.]